MPDRNKNRSVYETNKRYMREALERRGVATVRHHAGMTLNPVTAEIDNQLEQTMVVFSMGDRLGKLAYKWYGSYDYWWIIAWYNGKPADFACKVGDKIYIPFPLQRAIELAVNPNWS